MGLGSEIEVETFQWQLEWEWEWEQEQKQKQKRKREREQRQRQRQRQREQQERLHESPRTRRRPYFLPDDLPQSCCRCGFRNRDGRPFRLVSALSINADLGCLDGVHMRA